MNPEVKAKWVAALRSGDYKQSLGQLRNKNNRFCCLGVLCNVHAQEHPKVAAKQHHKDLYLGQDLFLPMEVKRWAGLSDSAGDDVSIKGEKNTLAGHNDQRRRFKTLAKAIEEQL